ncbi:MAG: hypothetical protein LBT90_03370, partial [Holosporaceae bacterium]|nr:hypothetical protein [Holosporaceae bacterium]
FTVKDGVDPRALITNKWLSKISRQSKEFHLPPPWVWPRSDQGFQTQPPQKTRFTYFGAKKCSNCS